MNSMYLFRLMALLVAIISLKVHGYIETEFPIKISEDVKEYSEKRTPEVIRILIIGDANDNLAVQDWCKSVPTRTLLTDKIWTRTSYSSHKKYLGEYLKPYGKRRKSWEVRLCESPGSFIESPGPSLPIEHPTVLVASLMNKFGVKTSPPFMQPIATLAGLDGREAANFTAREKWSIADLFKSGIGPGMQLLCEAMGGLPDAILVQSMHQDLAHPPEWKSPDFEESWGRGMHELLQVARTAFPQASYFTRTGVKFAVQHIEGHWNTADNLNHMSSMNNRLKVISKEEGFTVLDFASIADKSYFDDKMRPTFEEGVEFMDKLVKFAVNGRRQKKKSGATQQLISKQKKRVGMTATARRYKMAKSKGWGEED